MVGPRAFCGALQGPSREARCKRFPEGETREIYKVHTGAFSCGHDRSEENSYWLETGTQVCKTCRRARMAEAQRRLREKKRKDMEAINRILKAEKELAERKRREANEAERIERLNSVFVNELAAKVCEVLSCAQEDFYGQSRSKHLVMARSVLSALCATKGRRSRRLPGACARSATPRSFT